LCIYPVVLFRVRCKETILTLYRKVICHVGNLRGQSLLSQLSLQQIALSLNAEQPPNLPPNDEKKPEAPQQSEGTTTTAADTSAMDVQPEQPPEETWDDIPSDVLESVTDEIMTRVRLIENDIKVMRSETLRLQHEQNTMREKIRDNKEKIKQNKVLPYLVGNVVEVSL
jgi:26S proteasome regulatory subunit T5